MYTDLLLNLVSEVVGIFFTVFIVDRIIARREENRWKQAKYMTYVQLINKVDTTLQIMNFSSETQTICYFGDLEVNFNNYTGSVSSFERKETIVEIAAIKGLKTYIEYLLDVNQSIRTPEMVTLLLKFINPINQLEIYLETRNKRRKPLEFLLQSEFVDVALEILNYTSKEADETQVYMPPRTSEEQEENRENLYLSRKRLPLRERMERVLRRAMLAYNRKRHNL